MTTATKPAKKLMYSVVAAAELMDLDKNQVYILIRNGQLVAIDAKTNPAGRARLRVSHAAIETFMKRREIQTKKRAA